MLTLIALGKLKEDFYRSAVGEYEKRLKAYGGIRILELPEVRLPEPLNRSVPEFFLQGPHAQRLPSHSDTCVRS